MGLSSLMIPFSKSVEQLPLIGSIPKTPFPGLLPGSDDERTQSLDYQVPGLVGN